MQSGMIRDFSYLFAVIPLGPIILFFNNKNGKKTFLIVDHK